MPVVVHPPIWSMMSDGHSTALRRSLRLCRRPCTTWSPPVMVFIHLLRAALAEAREDHAKVGKVIRKEKRIHLGFTKDTASFRDCVAVIRNHFTSNGEPSWDLMDAAATCHGKGLENNTLRYGSCVVNRLKNRN